MRHFARPGKPDNAEALVEAVRLRKMENFHEFKLRLLMAVESEGKGEGVRLSDVYDRFQRLVPDRANFAREVGWDSRSVETIEAYRGREARYAYHSLEEIAEAFDAFTLSVGPVGRYPAAEICPVLTLTPKP
jgi:hypothetical protein